jgi:hypothetical protein
MRPAPAIASRQTEALALALAACEPAADAAPFDLRVLVGQRTADPPGPLSGAS